MNREHYHIAVEECELGIVGHKVFVRLKDIPMYLSKHTKDSIRNRYSHSVEVGLSTEYMLNHLSVQLGSDVDLNFFKVGKIVGLLHDIGHTAFSHDGETILDKMLQKASAYSVNLSDSMQTSIISDVSSSMNFMIIYQKM